MKRLLIATALLAPLPALADPFTVAALAIQGAVAAGAITATTAFFLTVGLTVVGTAHARRKARKAEARAKAQYNASLEDRSVTALGTIPPWRIVYGRPGPFGGDIVAIFTTDKTGTREDGTAYTKPDALKHLVIHVATHKCQAINEVYIDGIAVGALDGNGWATTGEFVTASRTDTRSVTVSGGGFRDVPEPVVTILNAYWNDGGQISTVTPTLSNGNTRITNPDPNTITVDYTISTTISHVRISKHLGDDNQTVNTYLNGLIPSQWTSNHRLRGICYVVLTLDLELQRFQGGPPNVTFDVSGRLLFDTRTSVTEYSRNNALAINDWLQAPWGYDVDATEVDTAFTNAAANVCSTQSNFTTNDPADGTRYDFTGSANGWTAAGATLTQNADSVTISSTGTDPIFRSPSGLSIAGATFTRVRVRVKRLAGSGWDGNVFYVTSGHGESASFRKDLADPSLSVGVWTELTWDMSTLTAGGSDWTSSTITQVRIDIGTTASDQFEVDWVSIQKPVPLYTCDGVFTTAQSRESVLEDLCESMAGFAVYGAKWQIIAGVWTPSVMDLTDDDLDGQADIAQAGASSEQIFNGVRGTYIAAGKSSPSDFEPYQNATFVTADGEPLWADVTLPFTNDKARCKNLARIFTERTRASLIVNYPAKLRALPLQVGDRVRVTNTEYGWTQKYFRVTDWQFGVTAPVSLVLQEDATEIYDLADAASADPTPNTGLPNPWIVQALTGVTAASGTTHLIRSLDGTISPRVLVSWNAVTDAYVADGSGAIEVLWRRPGSTAWNIVEALGTDTSAYITDVREGDPLVIEVRARNGLRMRGPSTFLAHTVVGKTQAPVNVAGLVTSITQAGVQFSWTPNTELDYDETELRVGGSGFSTGTRLFRGRASTWTWPFPAQGSYTVRAKHFDTSGNESASETVVAVTVDAAAQTQWGNIAGRPKKFRAVSVGLSDTQRPAAADLYDGETGSSLGTSTGRSYMLHRIRRSDGVITFSQWYDVYGNGAVSSGRNAATLAADLNATGTDHFVIVRTYDEPQVFRFQGGLDTAMYRCGASRGVFGSPAFKVRSAYVLVGIGGCGEGNGWEAYQGAVDEDSNAWCDVMVSLQNGNFTIGGSAATPRTIRDYSYTGDLNASADIALTTGGSGIVLTGNSAEKVSNGGAWNADVRSVEPIAGGCFVSFVVGSFLPDVMMGLNADAASSSDWPQLDYAIYLRGDGQFDVRLSGGNSPVLGSYAIGDTFLVTYDGANVRFHKNGVVVWTVAAAAGQSLYLDSSFWTAGAKLDRIRFGPMSPVTGITTGQVVDNAFTEVMVTSVVGPVDVTNAA